MDSLVQAVADLTQVANLFGGCVTDVQTLDELAPTSRELLDHLDEEVEFFLLLALGGAVGFLQRVEFALYQNGISVHVFQQLLHDGHSADECHDADRVLVVDFVAEVDVPGEDRLVLFELFCDAVEALYGRLAVDVKVPEEGLAGGEDSCDRVGEPLERHCHLRVGVLVLLAEVGNRLAHLFGDTFHLRDAQCSLLIEQLVDDAVERRQRAVAEAGELATVLLERGQQVLRVLANFHELLLGEFRTARELLQRLVRVDVVEDGLGRALRRTAVFAGDCREVDAEFG